MDIALNQWQKTIIDCASRVYTELGTGYSESVYHCAMEVEFRNHEIQYETKPVIPILYQGRNVGFGIADFIVFDTDGNGIAVVELKAVTYEPRTQEKAQVRTYLRSRTDVQFGLLINFRQPTATNLPSLDTCRIEHRPFLHSEEVTQRDNSEQHKSE